MFAKYENLVEHNIFTQDNTYQTSGVIIFEPLIGPKRNI